MEILLGIMGLFCIVGAVIIPVIIFLVVISTLPVVGIFAKTILRLMGFRK